MRGDGDHVVDPCERSTVRDEVNGGHPVRRIELARWQRDGRDDRGEVEHGGEDRSIGRSPRRAPGEVVVLGSSQSQSSVDRPTAQASAWRSLRHRSPTTVRKRRPEDGLNASENAGFRSHDGARCLPIFATTGDRCRRVPPPRSRAPSRHRRYLEPRRTVECSGVLDLGLVTRGISRDEGDTVPSAGLDPGIDGRSGCRAWRPRRPET